LNYQGLNPTIGETEISRGIEQYSCPLALTSYDSIIL